VYADKAIKGLSLSLFEYDQADLKAFHTHKKKEKQYANTTPQELVAQLPLSAFKRFVKRRYFDGALQAKKMEEWYAHFLLDPRMAVDINGRHLVAGGPDGMKAFDVVWHNQITHALNQKMSGEWSLVTGKGGIFQLQLLAEYTHIP
jgi:hypothetical protein